MHSNLSQKISSSVGSRQTSAISKTSINPVLPLESAFDNWSNHRIVILTAISVECLAVCEHLKKQRQVKSLQHTIYECGEFLVTSERTWNVAVAEIGEGNTSADRETERAINNFNPLIVMFVVVAGGIKDVKLGDVVAATKVYDYEFGKDEDTFSPRPNLGASTYDLEQLARATRRDWELRKESLGGKDYPNAFVAPIAAGSKVVASKESASYLLIKHNYGNAIAVEMEGFGLLDAVRANMGVSAIVIRGISDLIEDKERVDAAGYKKIAASHASNFAFEMLAKLDRESPPESVGEYVGAAQIQFDGTLPKGLVSFCVEKLAGGNEFYLHAHLEKQEFAKRGILYARLTELYDLLDTNQKPEAIISALDDCNAEMQEQRECIIRQFFVWLQKQWTLSPNAVTCLLIDDQTEFEIPWELLELDGHPLGTVMQTVRCRAVEPETIPMQQCCEGQVLMYAKPEYSELQGFQRCHLSDFQRFLDNLQQPEVDFGLVFIDGSSLPELLTSLTARLKRSRLFKTRSSVVFVGGQLSLDGTDIRRYRKFFTTFLTYGAKGVVGTLKAIEDSKTAPVVSSLFAEYRKHPELTMPELLHRLRQQAAQRLEDEVLTDENGGFYLAAFMHVYYGNPMAILKLLSVEGASDD